MVIAAVKRKMHLQADGVEVSARRKSADWAALALAVEASAGEWESDFSGMYRPVAGYNDYTYSHLPIRDKMPLPSKDVATPASLLARIARSSLLIRSTVR